MILTTNNEASNAVVMPIDPVLARYNADSPYFNPVCNFILILF